METKAALCAHVVEVLDKDNFVDWSGRVKTYLMAHELWDTIEATIEPPKKEDDEATFRAYSKKNFMALHVIQRSCGPDTFYEIRKISSAKIAWDTLAEKYQVPKNTNSVVSEVLSKDNYVDWSARVKTYLMAQDLWDIVEATTDSPKQEDDEGAFKAWSKKDFMALHVIQNSCGADTFSEIREIGSAKTAWDTLAKKYNGSTNTNSVVREALEKGNYVDWSARVKTYLMAQDLWDAVEATTDPPKQEDDEAAFKAWNKKDFMALHVIQNSCGPETFSEIRETASAKTAWDALARKYKLRDNNGNEDYDGYVKYVQSGDWNAAKEFLKCQPNAGSAKITDWGQTALHMAVSAGEENIVEELVELMLEEHLEIQEKHDSTALHEAVVRGNYRMAECMLRKNMKLTSIRNFRGFLPVVTAITYGQIEFARYLYPVTSLDDLKSENDSNGATLFTNAIYTRSLDIALDLIEKCPCLALTLDKDKKSPLLALASMPHLFKGRYRPMFWKRWIYNCIRIQLAAGGTNETRLDISRVEKCQNDQVKTIGLGTALLRRLVSNVRNFLGINHLYEIKLIHVQSDELLRLMCKEIRKSTGKQRHDGRVYDAIMLATKKGIFEFVSKMLKSKPDLARCGDEKSRNIFMLAVLHRQAEIFSHLCTLDLKIAATSQKDEDTNSILHMGGMSADSAMLNSIPGAALQMQREIQWFKEVENVVPPTVKEAINKDGLTPRELFTQNHKDMLKEGEQWMKDTTTSCTVVGALIITTMFAAAFTVPGGNDQNTGYPMFLNKKWFMLFIISDALSLFSSSTSVLMFLGILTSRYAEEDFLKSLPRKMIIGLTTLFFSIGTMMIAFSAALFIMLRGQSWIVIPAICLACVPVALFLKMQFPLLRDMFKSTYGSGIFARKMKHLL